MLFSARSLLALAMTAAMLTPSVSAVWVKYCEHSNYSGKCVEVTPKVNECYNLPSSMNDKLSSYKVDNGQCDFFKHGNCQERLWTARNRSHNDIQGADNDAVSSIRCTHSCCNADKFFACNLACNSSCRPPVNQPIVDQGCILRCAQDCCPEGVQCSG